MRFATTQQEGYTMRQRYVDRNHNWSLSPNPLLRDTADDALREEMAHRTELDLAAHRRQAYGSQRPLDYDGMPTDRQWIAYTRLCGRLFLTPEPRQSWTQATLTSRIRHLQRATMT